MLEDVRKTKRPAAVVFASAAAAASSAAVVFVDVVVLVDNLLSCNAAQKSGKELDDGLVQKKKRISSIFGRMKTSNLVFKNSLNTQRKNLCVSGESVSV